MVLFLFLMLLAALGLFVIIFMFLLLRKAPTQPVLTTKSTGLLPHDFFMILMFLFNIWLIVFILYVTKNLTWPEKQNFIIAASLFSPLLVWWWGKQFGGKQ